MSCILLTSAEGHDDVHATPKRLTEPKQFLDLTFAYSKEAYEYLTEPAFHWTICLRQNNL